MALFSSMSFLVSTEIAEGMFCILFLKLLETIIISFKFSVIATSCTMVNFSVMLIFLLI